MENNVSYFSKIISVFWEPTKTFKAISEKVSIFDIIIPLLLVIIVSWITTPIIKPVVKKTIRTKIEQMEQLPDEKKAEIIEKQVKQQDSFWSYIIIPFAVAIGSVLVGFVFLFVSNFILGGDNKFLPVWAVVTYSSLVDLIASAVKIPLIVQKGTLDVYTSIAIFMQDTGSFLFNFAKHLDIFSLWKVVLISIGLSVLSKKKLSNVLLIVIIIWLAYCAAVAGLSGLIPK
jgi:hypothetical protein